jgi:hypothetical protein
MNSKPTEVILKNAWTWWPFIFVVGISVVVFGMNGLNFDSIEYSAVLVVALAYGVLVHLRYRVILTDKGIAVQAWRHTFISRHEVTAIDVRRSLGRRRLTVICTDGTAVSLPVPWPQDPRWNEMVHETQQWLADSQHNDVRST